MSGDMETMFRNAKQTETFIESAERELAAVGQHIDRLPEPERQKFLTMKAEMAYERDQLELAKRHLYEWWIMRRAQEIRRARS